MSDRAPTMTTWNRPNEKWRRPRRPPTHRTRSSSTRRRETGCRWTRLPVQAVPSQWTIVPACSVVRSRGPTAQTSFGPVPETLHNDCPVPLATGCQAAPSQCRIVPAVPMAHIVLGSAPPNANDVRRWRRGQRGRPRRSVPVNDPRVPDDPDVIGPAPPPTPLPSSHRR